MRSDLDPSAFERDQDFVSENDSQFGNLDIESKSEILPFTVRIVRTEEQLSKVCELRAIAYGRHFPELAEQFGKPDLVDRDLCTLIFLAQDKLTGAAIGTARLQVNLHQRLQIEDSAALPAALTQLRLTEITRLSVKPGFNQFKVRVALWKACQLYCQAMQIRAMLITSRRTLVRQYLALGFQDVFPDKREVRCLHVGGLPHRVLILDAQSVERMWYLSEHPLYDFFYRTYHPDIEVFSAVSSGWARPRSSERRDNLSHHQSNGEDTGLLMTVSDIVDAAPTPFSIRISL